LPNHLNSLPNAIVGAVKTSHIDEAVNALSITLTDDEAERLEESYPPRIDPMVKNSDPKGIARTTASVGLNIAVPGASNIHP